MLKFRNQFCTGCRLCETACSASHSQEFAPTRTRIRVAVNPQDGECSVMACFSCPGAPCLAVCAEGAISRPARGLPLHIDLQRCDGCGICVSACPYGAMHFDHVANQPIVCDLCNGDPQCVKYCYAGAIIYTI